MTDLDIQIQEILSHHVGRLPGGGIDPEQAARALERFETALGRLETVERRLGRVAGEAERQGALGAVERTTEPEAPGPRCRRCQGTGVLSKDPGRGSARIACPRCDGEGTGHVC